ncbi:hypothetical protein [Massilia rubra]|uniref:DoxX family protein n=1 Tax=Massilia rubra TaxID=2607910 RepID=A0ABX0LSQ2_9BURK|nr:hypothetical protein [Massilia rubra]NHZ35356.1 hypothetical protein [Massilia rubra]
MMRFPGRSPGFLPTAFLLAQLCLLQLVCLWRAPPAFASCWPWPAASTGSAAPGPLHAIGDAVRAAAGTSALLAVAGVDALLLARLTLATAAGVLLLAVGLLAQLSLAGRQGSHLKCNPQKVVALLAIGLGIGAHLRLRVPVGTSGQAVDPP